MVHMHDDHMGILAHAMHEVAHKACDKNHPLHKHAKRMHKDVSGKKPKYPEPTSSSAPSPPSSSSTPRSKKTPPHSSHLEKIVKTAKDFLGHKLKNGAMMIYIPKTKKPLMERIKEAEMLSEMLKTDPSDLNALSKTITLSRGISAHLKDLHDAIWNKNNRGWQINPYVLAASGYGGSSVPAEVLNKFTQFKKQFAQGEKALANAASHPGKAYEHVAVVEEMNHKKPAGKKKKKNALDHAISETPAVEGEVNIMDFN